MDFGIIHKKLLNHFVDCFEEKNEFLCDDFLLFLKMFEDANTMKFWEDSLYIFYLKKCDILPDPFSGVYDLDGKVIDKKSLQQITDLFYSLVLLNLVSILNTSIDIINLSKNLNVYCKLKLKISLKLYKEVNLIDESLRKNANNLIKLQEHKKTKSLINNRFNVF